MCHMIYKKSKMHLKSCTKAIHPSGLESLYWKLASRHICTLVLQELCVGSISQFIGLTCTTILSYGIQRIFENSRFCEWVAFVFMLLLSVCFIREYEVHHFSIFQIVLTTCSQFFNASYSQRRWSWKRCRHESWNPCWHESCQCFG